MVFGKKATLLEKWRLLYENDGTQIDEMADKDSADWESLCVGWCMANGLTVNQAYDFYRAMVPVFL